MKMSKNYNFLTSLPPHVLKLYKNGPFGSLGLDVTNVKLLSCSQKNSAHLVDENPPRFKSKNLLMHCNISFQK